MYLRKCCTIFQIDSKFWAVYPAYWYWNSLGGRDNEWENKSFIFEKMIEYIFKYCSDSVKRIDCRIYRYVQWKNLRPLHKLQELHIVDYLEEKQNSWNEYIKWMPDLRLFKYRGYRANCWCVDIDRGKNYANPWEEAEARDEQFDDNTKDREIEIKFRRNLQFKTIEVFAFYDLELSLLEELTFDELEELKFSFHLKFNSVGSSFSLNFLLRHKTLKKLQIEILDVLRSPHIGLPSIIHYVSLNDVMNFNKLQNDLPELEEINCTFPKYSGIGSKWIERMDNNMFDGNINWIISEKIEIESQVAHINLRKMK